MSLFKTASVSESGRFKTEQGLKATFYDEPSSDLELKTDPHLKCTPLQDTQYLKWGSV